MRKRVTQKIMTWFLIMMMIVSCMSMQAFADVVEMEANTEIEAGSVTINEGEKQSSKNSVNLPKEEDVYDYKCNYRFSFHP